MRSQSENSASPAQSQEASLRRSRTLRAARLFAIEFVIDVDDDGELSGDDLVCRYEQQRAPGGNTWKFRGDATRCDVPNGLDLETLGL